MSSSNGQFKTYSIGFYNVENLFDTSDNKEIRDEEFLPSGKKNWTQEKYDNKVANLASVISQLGMDLCNEGVSLLGVSEIENDTVMQSIVNHPLLKSRNYGYVHHSSKDRRGIDVGLIYDKDVFTPTSTSAHYVDITKPKKNKNIKPELKTGEEVNSLDEEVEKSEYKRYTRDVLLVSGILDGEEIHVTINHWPSRSGGQKRTARLRNNAAKVNKRIVDSLYQINPNASIIVLGDLNDNPTDASLIEHLGCEPMGNQNLSMYNPMQEMFNNGKGSNAWRDTWSLFDQIVVSQPLTSNDATLKFHSAKIFNKKFLQQPTGRYKGYPFRSFAGDIYQKGFSDHFPVYIYLIKEVQ